MSKLRKIVSIMTVLALVLSISMHQGTSVVAENITEASENETATEYSEEIQNTEVSEKMTAQENTGEQTTEANFDMESESMSECPTELETFDETITEPETETQGIPDTEGQMETSQTERESMGNITETESRAEEATDDSVENVVPASLLPLKEVYANIEIKNGYIAMVDGHYKINAVNVDSLLRDGMKDAEGNQIEIPEEATMVWAYIRDENGNILRDECHILDSGEVMDLSVFEENIDYKLELIVGSGQQLDAGNVRYIVNVFVDHGDQTLSYITGDILSYENQQMNDVTGVRPNVALGYLLDTSETRQFRFVLKKGYRADEEYYCALTPYYSTTWNNEIDKVVVGLYDSRMEAEGQEDIKDLLFPTEKNKTPYGYKANYNQADGGVSFTIFCNYEAVKINISVAEYDPSQDPAYEENLTEDFVSEGLDPWFRITGAKQDGRELKAYVVENGKNELDSLYGYGYQTVFLDDDASLTSLQPTYWISDSEKIKVYVNGELAESGKQIVDFSAGPVQFTVLLGERQRNYWVEFVKKNEGRSKLFVFGPESRKVVLNAETGYKHDILIANLGSEPLTGLKVELHAKNCKLDDYWTLGGSGNDTLTPFSETVRETEYGELSNLAKIRLVPDGDGPVEGTLDIYADNHEPVSITLTGEAQNTRITTTGGFENAVYWVPSSYWIRTNNTDPNVTVSFSYEGELPPGMELFSDTGEIYGVPTATGTYCFSVTANFESETKELEPSTVDFKIYVVENSGLAVLRATDPGYEILDSVGRLITSGGTFVLSLPEYRDVLFRSNGAFGEFIDLWLNGQRLVRDVDYTAEEGSTKITIKSQTMRDKITADEVNTLAAEFRVNGKRNNELKRTAENFRLFINNQTEPPTEQPTETEPPTEKPAETESPTEKPAETEPPTEKPVETESEHMTEKSSETQEPTAAYVNCAAYIVDRNNAPVGNLLLELRSIPQTATTNVSGLASFERGIDFGNHTLSVINDDGSTAASKSFTLQSGESTTINGDVITAKSGSTITITMQYDAGNLNLLNVQEGIKQIEPVKTGDNTRVEVWMFILLSSCLAAFTILRYKKIKKQ